jgi:hypothetical protein
MRLYSYHEESGVVCGRLEGREVVLVADWRDHISDAALDDLEDSSRPRETASARSDCPSLLSDQRRPSTDRARSSVSD